MFVPPTSKAKHVAMESGRVEGNLVEEAAKAPGAAEYENLRSRIRLGWRDNSTADASEVDKAALDAWEKVKGRTQCHFNSCVLTIELSYTNATGQPM